LRSPASTFKVIKRNGRDPTLKVAKPERWTGTAILNDRGKRGLAALWSLARLASGPLQRYLERKLEKEVLSGEVPVHVGIIPDGNRRWARMKGMQEWLGHREGYKRMKEVLVWLLDLNIKVVTVFAMSTENCLKRSEEEREKLFELITKGLYELSEEKLVHERRVKVNVFGEAEMWPEKLRKAAEHVMEVTKNYGDRVFNVAICYGGRQEIVRAVRQIAKEVKEGKLNPEEISEETISSHLFTAGLPDPDLIIRTSGEERLSNFLLWQSAYSELYFVNSYWPEIRKLDILKAIRDYQRRQRRFGR